MGLELELELDLLSRLPPGSHFRIRQVVVVVVVPTAPLSISLPLPKSPNG